MEMKTLLFETKLNDSIPTVADRAVTYSKYCQGVEKTTHKFFVDITFNRFFLKEQQKGLRACSETKKV
jgi:hypothetical protein